MGPPKKIELKPERRETSIKKWAEDIDKLNRLNGQPWEHIEKVMLWSQNDSFWQANILSGNKLRKQFDTLQAQMTKSDPDAQFRARAKVIEEALDD